MATKQAQSTNDVGPTMAGLFVVAVVAFLLFSAEPKVAFLFVAAIFGGALIFHWNALNPYFVNS